ncbi:hypothetical protein [Rhizobium sp. PL01]|uniref:hypothetical protein n=1 Tax=Rhizobium sp. PL01 TaxID=3085631 RepID=UPI002980BC73|nr:hypothetical protein [Rhizobium sp. PL01]MDW5314996.1 hypothetical protein [Rhizobium sp. PL01]
MNEVMQSTLTGNPHDGRFDRSQGEPDPLSHAIKELRLGFEDFNTNAPLGEDAARAYAETSYRPPRRIIIGWSRPAGSMESAVAALRLAKVAYDEDDHAIVGPMVAAALAYLEQSAAASDGTPS